MLDSEVTAAVWQALRVAQDAGLAPATMAHRLLKPTENDLTDLLVRIGGTAIAAGNDALAQELYALALLTGSRNAAVAFNLGNIAIRSGEPADAIDAYDVAIAIDPGHARAYYNRGLQHRVLGDEKRARRDIWSAIVNGYNNVDVYAAYFRAELAYDVGAWSGKPSDLPLFALAQAEKTLRLIDSDNADLALLAAEWCLAVCRQARPQSIVTDVAMVVIMDVLATVHGRRGDMARNVGMAAEAVERSRVLAGLDRASWPKAVRAWIPFIVGRLPTRVGNLMYGHALSGDHEAVLDTAALGCADMTEDRVDDDAYLVLASALRESIYLAVRHKAEADSSRPVGWE